MSYDIEKLVDVLIFLAKNDQELTKLRINKLLYFIDKEHLRRYGRTILKDKYVSLRLGPLAERTNSILNDFIDCEISSLCSEEKNNLLVNYFKLSFNSNNYEKLELKKEVDLNILSESEKEVILDIVKKYGKFATSTLVNISHKDPAWENTYQNETIDNKLMLIGLPDEKRELLEEIIDLDNENELFLDQLNNA